MNTWYIHITKEVWDEVAVMMEQLQNVEEFTRKDYDTFKNSLSPMRGWVFFGCSLDWMVKRGLIEKVREEEFTVEAGMSFWAVKDAEKQCKNLIELLDVDEKAARALLKEKRGIDLENETQTIQAKRYYYKAASMDAFEDVLADWLAFKDNQQVERVKKALNKTGLDKETLRNIVTELLF